MAEISEKAFVMCSSLNEHLPTGYTFVKCIHDRRTDTEGFIAEGPSDSVIVAFRGSETTQGLYSFFKDWVATNILGGLFPRKLDSRFRRCSSTNACVHGGFYRAVDSIYPPIMQVLDPYIKNSNKKIYITGASLGGAVGTVFTYKLANEYKAYRDRINMFVFATPPLGNAAFNERFNSLDIRSSYDITLVGDTVSYPRCWVPIVASIYYRRPDYIYYLPRAGGHVTRQYISQLMSIQTRSGYIENYNLNNE